MALRNSRKRNGGRPANPHFFKLTVAGYLDIFVDQTARFIWYLKPGIILVRSGLITEAGPMPGSESNPGLAVLPGARLADGHLLGDSGHRFQLPGHQAASPEGEAAALKCGHCSLGKMASKQAFGFSLKIRGIILVRKNLRKKRTRFSLKTFQAESRKKIPFADCEGQNTYIYF